MKIIDMDLQTLFKQIKKPTANPGGGATIIIIAAMAVNLIRMMDNVSHETLDQISERMEELIQEDVNKARILIDQYKKGPRVDDKYFIEAAGPQMELVELCIKALDSIGIFLKKGKIYTLSDGIIANNLLFESVKNAMPTIRINLEPIGRKYPYEEKLDQAEKIYNKNLEIIEGRKQ